MNLECDLAKDLITHLLCVDPAQRYTIDEFLAHPWCTASSFPLPEPTPIPARALDSPLLAEARGGVAREARSPGVAQLKEAFDITYAVHRMEEEGARRRAQKGGANRGFLGELNEGDEEDDIADGGIPVVDTMAARQEGRAGQRDRGARKSKAPFELDLDGATLLGRRHRRAAPAGQSPLARADGVIVMQKSTDEVPMSPMRVD